MKKVLYWIPRIITWLLTIALLVIFTGALVVRCGATELIDLTIPLGLALISFLAWKIPLFGGIAFTILGGSLIVYSAFGQAGGVNLSQILIIGLPILISGVLFLIEGAKERKNNKKS